jgi:hypothetical protein
MMLKSALRCCCSFAGVTAVASCVVFINTARLLLLPLLLQAVLWSLRGAQLQTLYCMQCTSLACWCLQPSWVLFAMTLAHRWTRYVALSELHLI